MSKRLAVLVALTAHLEGINEDNGFRHNLKGNVYRGRTLFGDEFKARLPFLSILEGKSSDYGINANDEQTKRKDDWVLLVQGFSRDDPRNPTDPAYLLLADVEKRLSQLIATDESGNPQFPAIFRLGGMIATLTLAQPIVRPPEAGVSDTAFFYLPIRVCIDVDICNP